MKRRNFLKLPLYAGFAAVFGVKLRAEPKLTIYKGTSVGFTTASDFDIWEDKSYIYEKDGLFYLHTDIRGTLSPVSSSNSPPK